MQYPNTSIQVNERQVLFAGLKNLIRPRYRNLLMVSTLLVALIRLHPKLCSDLFLSKASKGMVNQLEHHLWSTLSGNCGYCSRFYWLWKSSSARPRASQIMGGYFWFLDCFCLGLFKKRYFSDLPWGKTCHKLRHMTFVLNYSILEESQLKIIWINPKWSRKVFGEHRPHLNFLYLFSCVCTR